MTALLQPIGAADATSLPVAAIFLGASTPLLIVVVLSVVVGLLMILLFGYTSDQKAIKIAKDRLKAHLLAVRLFQDQLHVVAGSYGRILGGTARYLRLAFMPLLYVIIPITLLIVQGDHYLGLAPLRANAPFLLTAQVQVEKAETLNDVSLELPPEIAMTAPAVHVPADREIVWRLAATKNGDYQVKLTLAGHSETKVVRVGTSLARISPVRLKRRFWERLFYSAEPAIADGSPVESITVTYPLRNIDVAGYEINWIWLFFVLSMIAGYIFKELLGIQV